jgi:hypothetical protein
VYNPLREMRVFFGFFSLVLVTMVFLVVRVHEIRSPQVQGVAVTPSPTPVPTATPVPMPTVNYQNLKVTFWGWSDNSPPGNGLAYPHSGYPVTIHEVAGGVGSFSDPVSAAARDGRFAAGTRFYAPFIKKYLILEDICSGCQSDHIDIWMNSDGSHKSELDQCEGHFTVESTKIEVNPPAGREVNTAPLFDPSSGRCS